VREIKILINEDNADIEKRFSSLESAISRKNDNSFLINEIRDLRKLVNEKDKCNESLMSNKIGMLDNRLNSIFKIVSGRIENMSKKLDDNRSEEIKELITNNSKIMNSRIDESKNEYQRMMNKKIDAMENLLEKALAQRPQTNIYNTTSFESKPSYMPFVA